MQTLISKIFSVNGRLNRQKYFFYSLIIYVLLVVIDRDLNSIFFLLIGVFLLYQLLRIRIKRFHDINRSGVYCFGALVPFYNIYLLFLLYFSKGTEGNNAYGADLLKHAAKK